MSADTSGVAVSASTSSVQLKPATVAGRTADLGGGVTPQKDKPSNPVDVEKIAAALDRVNRMMASEGRNLKFSVDGPTEKVVIRVTDTETNEVIRQIPNEEALKLSEHIQGMLGIIFESKI